MTRTVQNIPEGWSVKKMINKIKFWAKTIFCSKITWCLVALVAVVANPGYLLKQYIPADWYLWFMLIGSAFLLWVLFKASHNCRKATPKDMIYMGGIYCLGLFFCFTSPMTKDYPEEDIERLLNCLTAFGPLIVGFAAVYFACNQWEVAKLQILQQLKIERLKLAAELDEISVHISDENGVLIVSDWLDAKASTFIALLPKEFIDDYKKICFYLLRLRNENISTISTIKCLKEFTDLRNKLANILVYKGNEVINDVMGTSTNEC